MNAGTALPDSVVQQDMPRVITAEGLDAGEFALVGQRFPDAHRWGVFKALEQGGLLCFALYLPEAEAQKNSGQCDQDQAQCE
jgi:hypothetical protein